MLPAIFFAAAAVVGLCGLATAAPHAVRPVLGTAAFITFLCAAYAAALHL